MHRYIFTSLLLVAVTLFSKEEELLISSLNGILFSSSEEVLKSSTGDCYGLHIEDLFVPDRARFIKEMEGYLGSGVSLTTLEEIRQSILKYYSDKAYPIVGVTVPKQDVSSGCLSILVIVGRLGELQAEKAKYFSNEKIAAMIRTKPGEYINASRMREDLDWINLNPFRTTDIIYEPGENLGETDVTLLTKDRLPWELYAGYQNTGNIIAGRSRYYSGITWGNAWGIGHELNYQLIMSDPFGDWHAHLGNYLIPLPMRNVLQFFGAYVKTKPLEGSDADSNGNSWQIAARYNIPFVFLGYVKNTLVFSYEFKRTNNFLSFATDQIFNNSIDISQFALGYDVNMNYRLGMTELGVSLYFSPGKMTAFNKDSNFSQERSGADSRYIYGKLRVDQMLTLPWKFSWVLNALFQQATGKLLPSEEISLGGYATVRGYDENEVIGDNGILIKNELRSPPIALPKFKIISQNMQFLVFLDFGYTYDADESILNKQRETLGSIGPGIRYTFGRCVNVRFDYGWQLDSIMRKVDDSHKHSRGHFAAHCAF